jgi:hypothetical protein
LQSQLLKLITNMYCLPPVGSGSAGNISLPHMAQAAAAVTMPANPERFDVKTLAFVI